MADPKHKKEEGDKPPVNLPAVEQKRPDPVETIDFTTGKGAKGVEVEAAKNIPFSMLQAKGLEVPGRLLRGRVERGTTMRMSKSAADWLKKLKYAK